MNRWRTATTPSTTGKWQTTWAPARIDPIRAGRHGERGVSPGITRRLHRIASPNTVDRDRSPGGVGTVMTDTVVRRTSSFAHFLRWARRGAAASQASLSPPWQRPIQTSSSGTPGVHHSTIRDIQTRIRPYVLVHRPGPVDTAGREPDPARCAQIDMRTIAVAPSTTWVVLFRPHEAARVVG